MAVWSEISTSSLVGALRLDAEFWQPKYLDKERKIRSGGHTSLGALVTTFKKGIFYILAREYADQGVPFYRSSNVGVILPNEDNISFITEKKHSEEYKTALTTGDLMIVKTGKSGASVVFDERCNVSQDVIAAKTIRHKINPYYLAVFLNTQYGKSEMDRWFQGQVQPHLSLEDARKICVSLIPDDAQSKVEQLVIASATARKDANSAWDQAQQLLESELGLDKLRFDKPVGYTARFSVVGLSDSVSANRIDAQCFSPEAVFYEDWLLKHANCDRLSLLLASTAKGRQQAEAETGTTNYCSIKHITGHEIVGASKAYPAAGTPTARKHDLLLAITGATIGKIGIVNRYDNLVFSGDMLRLRANGSINPHYLLLALDHHLGQVQFNRWITGSTNGHLAPRDVGRVLVPRLAPKKEEQIAALVAESLEKRQESEQLLDQAKSRVEQLIEEAVRR